jgi:hypothetical protein
MHFDLIQSISLAGKASVPNDDRAGCHGALGWVIDGATDLGPPGLVGARGGAAWIAEAADRGFAASEAGSIAGVYRDVFDRIARAYAAARQRDPLGDWELPIAAGLAARLGVGTVAWGALGDCVGLLAHGDTVTRFGRAPSKAAEGDQAASVAHIDADALRVSLRPGRAARRSAVISTDPADLARLESGTLPCAPGDEMLLMTDGFAALVEVYGVYDPATLIAALRRDGLAALVVELRAIEAGDAARDRFPRFKPSDDATALWLRVAD